MLTKEQLKFDAGLNHMPTDLTYECRMAVSGEGPRSGDWFDKPHRIVYDLCQEIEKLKAQLCADCVKCGCK
jgi:hypothetical protein